MVFLLGLPSLELTVLHLKALGLEDEIPFGLRPPASCELLVLGGYTPFTKHKNSEPSLGSSCKKCVFFWWWDDIPPLCTA